MTAAGIFQYDSGYLTVNILENHYHIAWSMDMKKKSTDNVEILILDGRIDQEGSEELEGVLQDCLDKGKNNICIDMVDVKHICSSALGVLVAIKRRIKDNEGDIKLVIVNDNLLRLFETTMLDKVFEIFESQRECLSTFD
jgi:anti-sigma B factor antagonist